MGQLAIRWIRARFITPGINKRSWSLRFKLAELLLSSISIKLQKTTDLQNASRLAELGRVCHARGLARGWATLTLPYQQRCPNENYTALVIHSAQKVRLTRAG